MEDESESSLLCFLVRDLTESEYFYKLDCADNIKRSPTYICGQIILNEFIARNKEHLRQKLLLLIRRQFMT